MEMRNTWMCLLVLMLSYFWTLWPSVAHLSSENSCPALNRDQCKPDFCNKVRCPLPEECPGGHIKISDSPCDCCGTCIVYLGENETCGIDDGSIDEPTKSRCKRGLICEENICKVNEAVSSCLRVVQHRKKVLDYLENEKYVFSRELWIPKCDSRGLFEAKQCKKKKCFCVDEDGNRLFGQEERDLSQNMTCGCSRNARALQEENRDLWMTRPQHHCSQDGNYDTLQCLNDICYCADPITGDVEGKVAKMGFMDMLHCYDPKKHSKLYKTQCEKQIMRARSLIYWFKQKGMHIVGLEDVHCDIDGSFSPRQCQTDSCVCTDRNGVSIKSYRVEAKLTGRVQSMTCRCARDEHDREIFHSRYPRMVCDNRGNHVPYQCFDGKCYCVDEDGDVIMDIPLESADINQLDDFCSCRRNQVVDVGSKLEPCPSSPPTTDESSSSLDEPTTDDDDYNYNY